MEVKGAHVALVAIALFAGSPCAGILDFWDRGMQITINPQKPKPPKAQPLPQRLDRQAMKGLTDGETDSPALEPGRQRLTR